MDPTGELQSSFVHTTIAQTPFPSTQTDGADARIEGIMQQLRELQDALKLSEEQNNHFEKQIQTLKLEVTLLSKHIFESLAKQALEVFVLSRRVTELEDEQRDELSGLFSMTTFSESSNNVCLLPVEVSKQSTEEHKKPADRENTQLARPASEDSRPKKISKGKGPEFPSESVSNFGPFSVGLNNQEKTDPPRKIVKQLTDGMLSKGGRRLNLSTRSLESEERLFKALKR